MCMIFLLLFFLCTPIERAAILSDTLVRSRQASYWCIRNIVYFWLNLFLLFFSFLRVCLLASSIDCFTFLGFSVKTNRALLFFSRLAEPLHSESQSRKTWQIRCFFSSARRYKEVQWRSISKLFRLRGSSAKSIAKKTNFCLGFPCFRPLKYSFYTSANRMFVPVRSTNR